MIRDFFRNLDRRRAVSLIIGNVFTGMGISIFKLSGLGNEPFSGMVMALSDCTGSQYAFFLILVNLVIFIAEITMGRELIGLGTAVNALLLGYIVTFFFGIWEVTLGMPSVLWQKLLTVFVGVVVCSFGLSLYQTSDVGVAPYDSLALIMCRKQKKISYFWGRMACDVFCAVVCFAAGGIVGLGTLVSALGLGPFVQFFNKTSKNFLTSTGGGMNCQNQT